MFRVTTTLTFSLLLCLTSLSHLHAGPLMTVVFKKAETGVPKVAQKALKGNKTLFVAAGYTTLALGSTYGLGALFMDGQGPRKLLTMFRRSNKRRPNANRGARNRASQQSAQTRRRQ